jgi:hypothetical protein
MTDAYAAPRTITIPLPCITCDYNLQGLPEDARCPECALPIRQSIDGRISPQRLRHIRRQTHALAWLITIKAPFTCAGFVAYIIGAVVLLALAGLDTSWLIAIGGVGAAIVIAVVVMEWFAFWRLTSPAGVRGMSAKSRSDIGFLRAGIVVQAVAAPVAGLFALADAWIGVSFAILAVGVGRFVQFLASMIVFARLARALRNQPLATWCTTMAAVIPVVAVFGSVLYGLGGLVAAGLLIATAIRMNNAVAREMKSRRRPARPRRQAAPVEAQ